MTSSGSETSPPALGERGCLSLAVAGAGKASDAPCRRPGRAGVDCRPIDGITTPRSMASPPRQPDPASAQAPPPSMTGDTAHAHRRLHAFLPEEILRQDDGGRRRLQGHGQARALAAGALRSRRAQEDRRRPQGLSADPLLPAAADRKLLQDAAADRRADPPHATTASPSCAPRRETTSRAGSRRCRSARPTPARAEAERAIKNGALGVQIYTNVARQADRPAGIPAVLEEDERARQADLDPSGARRRDAGLSAGREEIALRNLVDARLVLRDRLRDDAARLFQDHGRLSEPEDHHAPFRRHRADARRPARPGQ